MKMDKIIEELLDDDALDPKKLFNEEEYSTLIIGREGFNKNKITVPICSKPCWIRTSRARKVKRSFLN